MTEKETATFLGDLPFSHPLRNSALIDIGAETQYKAGGAWRPVKSSWSIARESFNDLCDCWTLWHHWRATK